MRPVNRRDLLRTCLGAPAAWAAGCSRAPPLPPQGEIVGAADAVGHRLVEEATLEVAAQDWQDVAMAIIGAGIAGLTAAWQLKRAGLDDFVLLELEPSPGGVSRSGCRNGVAYPWGAHYLPVPLASNRPLVELLEEMQVVQGRDDYGLTVEQTSAWAGVFYFASRLKRPDTKAQPLVTWPEGNGRVVAHLAHAVGDRLKLNCPVRAIVPTERDGQTVCEVIILGREDQPPRGFRARRVIFAAPQFMAPFVIRGFRQARGQVAAEFQYGAWLVANLSLRDRPAESGFPLAWDNVLYDSPGLGYVTATHQCGRDWGPTVLTYYYALCADNPRAARGWLLGLDWEECAEIVLSDLERAHPDLRGLITRLDVMRWGHAMISPRPGFLWGAARQAARQPFHGVHFAHSDLSGVALLEEAFYHGRRAAGEVLVELGRS